MIRLKAGNSLYWLVWTVCLALISFPGSPGAAEDPEIELQAREIFGNVLSPFCPGRSLEDCPSGAASKLRSTIKEKLYAGESRDDVEEYLFSLYGDDIRAVPEKTGFGLAAWVAAPLFLLSGIILILLWLRFHKIDANSGTVDKLDAAVEERIERELM